jgi:outer membrane autotransporter protein
VHGANDKAYADGYFFAVAGHMPVKAFSVDLTGFVQHNVIDVARSTGGATGHTTNLVGGGSVQVGYPIADGDVLPFARLTVASLDADGFSEVQSAGLALDVTDVSRTAVRGMLGIDATHVFTTESGTQLVPRFTLGIEEEFGGRSRALGMTFASTAFTSPAATPAPLSAIVGAGLTARMTNRLDVHIGVNGRVSSNQREGVLDLGVRYAF